MHPILLQQINSIPFLKLAEVYGLYDFLTPIKESRYQILIVKDDPERDGLTVQGPNKRVITLQEIDEITQHRDCEIHLSRGALGVILYQGYSAVTMLIGTIYKNQDAQRKDYLNYQDAFKKERAAFDATIAAARGQVQALEKKIQELETKCIEYEIESYSTKLSTRSKAAKKEIMELGKENRALTKKLNARESELEALSDLT